MPWKDRAASVTPQAARTRQQAPRAVQTRFAQSRQQAAGRSRGNSPLRRNFAR